MAKCHRALVDALAAEFAKVRRQAIRSVEQKLRRDAAKLDGMAEYKTGTVQGMELAADIVKAMVKSKRRKA